LPKDAGASVRAAVQRSTAQGGAGLSESMSNKGEVIALLTGRVSFRDKAVRMQNASGGKPAAYAPYETRFVDGWNYVPIDAGVPRPPTLRATARWVAFRYGYRHTIPIPGPLSPPGLVLEVLDALQTEPLIAARFVGPATAHTSRVQFGLSRIGGVPGPKDVVWTVSITARGLIDGITNVVPDGSQIRFRLSYVGSSPKVEPPPASQVQRLAPNENLYSTTTTPTA
jgi:hypothetical protein